MSRVARCVALLLAASAMSACTGSHHHALATNSATPPEGAGPGTSARLAKLHSVLPTGFAAPGAAAGARHVLDLNVAPAAGFQPSDVRLAPTPSKGQLRGVLAAVLNLPVPIIARGLYSSSDTLSPGAQITIAAAALSPGTHPVLFILRGPDYRADHLVQAANQVAAGVVTLPAHLAPGTWYVAVEDQEGITTNASGAVTGTALVDIAQFVVS